MAGCSPSCPLPGTPRPRWSVCNSDRSAVSPPQPERYRSPQHLTPRALAVLFLLDNGWSVYSRCKETAEQQNRTIGLLGK